MTTPTKHPSLADQHEARCIHFTGLSRGPCRAGIDYDTVRMAHAPIPCTSLRGTAQAPSASYPCLRDLNPGGATCAHLRFPTREEAEAYERESHAHFAREMQAIADDVCPTHRITIRREQVGRCVYAEPCGCRLYQGTLPRNYTPKHERIGVAVPLAIVEGDGRGPRDGA